MPISELLNTGVYAVFAGMGALGLLMGLVRGFSRQTVKLITVIAAFLISLAIYQRAYPYLITIFEEKTLLEVAQMLGLTFNEEVTSYLEVIEGQDAIYILSIPLTVVVIPLCFLFTMGSLIIILSIPHMIICGALGFTRGANGPIGRLLGGAVGAAQGLFIAALIIMPVAGVVDIANEAVTVAETEHPGFKNTDQISKLYHENVDTVASNPVLKAVNGTFGYIYDGFTTIDVEGEELHIETAVDDIVELYVYYGELGGGEKFQPNRPSENDKKIIDDMINSFGDDRLMTVLVSDFFRALGTSSESGAFVLQLDEPVKTLMSALLTTFATVDEENIEDDLHTFAKVYYLLADEKALDSSDISQKFTVFLNLDENGNSAFKRLCMILEENPRYAHMSTTLSTIAMDMLLQNSGIDKDTVETLNEVKNTVNEVLNINKEDYETPEEYKEAVNENLSQTLIDNGIELEEEQMDEITDYIIQHKEETGKTEFTDADMADFMAKYYDVYAKGQEGGIPTIPPGIEIP